MEANSGESDYFDCVTDRSGGSSSEELEYQPRIPNVATKEMLPLSGDWKGNSAKDEVLQRKTTPIRRFRRIDNNNNRRQIENVKADKSTVAGSDLEVKRTQAKQTGDGYELCGYELRAPPHSTHALKRLSMDAATVDRKEGETSQTMRSKVQEEVLKVLFGPPDAKTPDEEKYELVEQEEVTRGMGRTGILFRFSMWATLGFVTWVLAGRRAKVGCSEFFPNVRERDPVPKVIVRKQTVG